MRNIVFQINVTSYTDEGFSFGIYRTSGYCKWYGIAGINGCKKISKASQYRLIRLLRTIPDVIPSFGDGSIHLTYRIPLTFERLNQRA